MIRALLPLHSLTSIAERHTPNDDFDDCGSRAVDRNTTGFNWVESGYRTVFQASGLFHMEDPNHPQTIRRLKKLATSGDRRSRNFHNPKARP